MYLHDIHVLFSAAFASRGLRAQRRLSRRKAIPIFDTKEKIFLPFTWGEEISIPEYVSEPSRMRINWKSCLSAGGNNFCRITATVILP